MDVSAMDGMEEVRSSILLSSTENPRSQAWGFVVFREACRVEGLRGAYGVLDWVPDMAVRAQLIRTSAPGRGRGVPPTIVVIAESSPAVFEWVPPAGGRGCGPHPRPFELEMLNPSGNL